MNKNNARDYLPLVQTLAEGKTIQMDSGVSVSPNRWIDATGELSFFNDASQYRVKPEPLTVWVNLKMRHTNTIFDRGAYLG